MLDSREIAGQTDRSAKQPSQMTRVSEDLKRRGAGDSTWGHKGEDSTISVAWRREQKEEALNDLPWLHERDRRHSGQHLNCFNHRQHRENVRETGFLERARNQFELKLRATDLVAFKFLTAMLRLLLDIGGGVGPSLLWRGGKAGLQSEEAVLVLWQQGLRCGFRL